MTFGSSSSSNDPSSQTHEPHFTERHTNVFIVHQMPIRTTLQISAAHLTDFLKSQGGGVLDIVCERDDREPTQPYADFGYRKEHRMTLSYGLCSALVYYMQQQHAEPRSDGTFVLTDDRI
jgi:hypothetical protein